jgi:hypothetical protein
MKVANSSGSPTINVAKLRSSDQIASLLVGIGGPR